MARAAVSFAVAALLAAAIAGDALALTSNGQLRMYITDDGVGTIINWTSEPAPFDGYAVTSSAGLIDVAGWTPIAEQAATDPGIAAALGQSTAEALQWTTTSVAPDLIGETHPTTPAVLSPGGSFSLGAAFGGDWWDDLTFTYYDSTTGSSWDNTVWPPPACESEPLDLGGPYLWDVTIAPTLTCAGGNPNCTIQLWSILEYPQLDLGYGSITELSWPALQAAGVTFGPHTLHAGGFTNCGTWSESTTTLTIIPEPATLALLTLGAAAVRRRR